MSKALLKSSISYYYHVCLLPGIVGPEEIMQCGYQLRLTGVAGSEAVISVCQYVMPLQNGFAGVGR